MMLVTSYKLMMHPAQDSSYPKLTSSSCKDMTLNISAIQSLLSQTYPYRLKPMRPDFLALFTVSSATTLDTAGKWGVHTEQ